MSEPRALDWMTYWTSARHHYFKNFEGPGGAWGVRDSKTDTVKAVGMDKSDAAAFACMLNGDFDYAADMLKYHGLEIHR